MTLFGKALEQRAQQLLAGKKVWAATVPASIERDIGLVLDKLERLGASLGVQRRELLEAECHIDVQVMQTSALQMWHNGRPLYGPPEVMRQYTQLDVERRRLTGIYDAQLMALHEQLLVLLNKHALLLPDGPD